MHDTGTLYLSLNRKGDSHKLPGERIRAYSIKDQDFYKPAEPVINLLCLRVKIQS